MAKKIGKWETDEVKEWKHSLTTENFIFYTKPEETDENGNTMMFDRKMNFISDNYFATSALMEELTEIYFNQVNVLMMSPEMLFNFQCLIESGYFEE